MNPVRSVWVGSLRGDSGSLATGGFALAGVEWAGPADARIVMRARGANGRWSRWAPASVLGHDSDGGESARHALVGQPVWFGPSSALQLRSDRRAEGVSVHLVAAEDGLGRTGAGAGPQAGTARSRPLAAPVLAAGPGQPPIIARHAWAGSGHRPAYPPAYGDVRLGFVHHTDNPNGYAPGHVPAMLRGIYAYHRWVNGWNDIGYNFIVDLYGGVWEARAGGIDQAVCGAHAGGYNLESTGVALLGTFSAAAPTPAALSGLERLLAWKLSLHGLPVRGRVRVEVDPADAFYTPFRPGARVSLPRIAGHRDGCSTSCPGSEMYARLPGVRAAAALLAGPVARVTLGASGGVDAPETYLSLASALVPAGQPVVLSGVLESLSGGGAASGASVELQALTPMRGDPVLAAVGIATTGADGSYSVTLAPTANLLVRAVAPGPPAAVSPLVAVAVAPVVTLALVPPATGAPAGAPVQFSGSVQPVKPHVEVTARYAAGHRRVAKSARVAVDPSTGQFTASLALKPGSYAVVASVAADARNVASASAPVSVAVPQPSASPAPPPASSPLPPSR